MAPDYEQKSPVGSPLRKVYATPSASSNSGRITPPTELMESTQPEVGILDCFDIYEFQSKY